MSKHLSPSPKIRQKRVFFAQVAHLRAKKEGGETSASFSFLKFSGQLVQKRLFFLCIFPKKEKMFIFFSKKYLLFCFYVLQ